MDGVRSSSLLAISALALATCGKAPARDPVRPDVIGNDAGPAAAPYTLRVTYVGEGFRKGYPAPDYQAVLTAGGTSYDLGGITMKYFGYAWCGECPATEESPGMPPDAPVTIRPGTLMEFPAMPEAATTGVCPSGQRCVGRAPVPAGTYQFTVVGDVFECGTITVTIPLAADAELECRRVPGASDEL